MKNILICGGRDFNNYKILDYTLDNFLAKNNLTYNNVEIVSGHAEGTDSLGELYAKNHNVKLKIFPAEWNKFGKAAGPVRNRQMIDYIKNNDSYVIGFVGPKSKGTKNTLQLAKKENIPVIEIAYDLQEDFYEDLTEGIRIDSETGNFNFDFTHDAEEDLIHLVQTKINLSKFNNNLYYFGYKIIKSNPQEDRYKLLNYIKLNDNECIEEMISKSLEMFFENSPIKDFDYLLEIPSKSSINSDICKVIKKSYDSDAVVINAAKKPIEKLEINFEKIKNSFKYNNLDGVFTYFEKLKDSLQKSSEFSISKIPPRFRRYFNSMIELNNVELEDNSNILIIDDILSSGSSITAVLSELEKLNFKGNIVIFTLINNR